MNGRARTRPQRGFSLVEMMVAIAIGAILLVGAIAMFVSNRDTYQIATQASALQENARFALGTLTHDIRMAGYSGCANALSAVRDQTGAPPGALLGLADGIEGINDIGASGANWSPSNVAAYALQAGSDGNAGQALAGTDAITLRFLSGTGAQVNSVTTGRLTVTSPVPITFTPGAPYAISDCGGTDLFLLKQVAGSGGSYTLTPVQPLARVFTPGTGTQVAALEAVRYYIGLDPSGVPALYRETLAQGAPGSVVRQEMVDGVQNMQLLYGVDTNGDGSPDAYYPAGDVHLGSKEQWQQVVAVRLALLMRSDQPYGTVKDTRTYTLDDQTVGPFNDTYRRRVFSSTVFVRNQH